MPCFLTPEWWKKRVSGSSLGSKSPQLATSRGSPGGREDLWGQTRKRLRLGSTRRNWDPQPPAIIGHQSKKQKKHPRPSRSLTLQTYRICFGPFCAQPRTPQQKSHHPCCNGLSRPALQKPCTLRLTGPAWLRPKLQDPAHHAGPASQRSIGS